LLKINFDSIEKFQQMDPKASDLFSIRAETALCTAEDISVEVEKIQDRVKTEVRKEETKASGFAGFFSSLKDAIKIDTSRGLEVSFDSSAGNDKLIEDAKQDLDDAWVSYNKSVNRAKYLSDKTLIPFMVTAFEKLEFPGFIATKKTKR
jgi:hypothetical protein